MHGHPSAATETRTRRVAKASVPLLASTLPGGCGEGVQVPLGDPPLVAELRAALVADSDVRGLDA